MALPDYTISVLNKATGKKSGNIGAAWVQEDGRINIQLNPGAALIGGMPDMLMTLFPYDGGPSTQAPPPISTPRPVPRKPQPTRSASYDDLDDDIPFIFNMNVTTDTAGLSKSRHRIKNGPKTLHILRANQIDF